RKSRSIPMHASPPLALRIGGDGQTIVALPLVASPNRVFLTNAATDVSATHLRLDPKHGGDGTPIHVASLSADGQLLATVNCLGRCDLWEVASGRRLRRLDTPAVVQDVAFSPDGRFLAVITELGRGQAAELWSCTSGERLHRLRGDVDGTWLK